MKRVLLVIALVAAAAPLAAQQKNEVSAFFDDPVVASTDAEGTKVLTGYGVALRHFSTPHWSTELSVARHYQYGAYFYAVDAGAPAVPPQSFRARVLPIDLITSYHFAPDRRFQPYAGIGLHYLAVLDGPGLETQRRLELAGGVAYRVTPHFLLRADVKRLLGGSSLRYDPDTRAGYGFGWRF
jgi:outer membrane protein W